MMPSEREQLDTAVRSAVSNAVSDAAENERRAFARGRSAGEASVLYEVEQLRAKLAKAAGNTRPHKPDESVQALLAAIEAAIAVAKAGDHSVVIGRDEWTAVVQAYEAAKGAK